MDPASIGIDKTLKLTLGQGHMAKDQNQNTGCS